MVTVLIDDPSRRREFEEWYTRWWGTAEPSAKGPTNMPIMSGAPEYRYRVEVPFLDYLRVHKPDLRFTVATERPRHRGPEVTAYNDFD
jgi:hypothetical protein